MTYWNKALGSLPQVDPQQGGSGFFSSPDDSLDPRLFDSSERLRPEVRTWLVHRLLMVLGADYLQPSLWLRAWLAGSGISYQWSADRSNGDLDVLFAINWPKFFASNDHMVGFSAEEVSTIINNDLRKRLWPETARTLIGTSGEVNAPTAPGAGVFEVTFYCNPQSFDIKDINPYAAYDLMNDVWTVRPPDLPEHPEDLYPADWASALGREVSQAQDVISRYNESAAALGKLSPGSPGWTNAMHQVNLVVSQASSMFDDIHLGRKKAFQDGGTGYGDFYNYRWQSHKRAGTVQALNAISQVKKVATEAVQSDLYGHLIDSSSDALVKAAMWGKQ